MEGGREREEHRKDISCCEIIDMVTVKINIHLFAKEWKKWIGISLFVKRTKVGVNIHKSLGHLREKWLGSLSKIF